MAVGACGYNCPNAAMGNKIEFPHVIETGNSMCPQVHEACLAHDVHESMWAQNPLTCPSCGAPGDAGKRISRKERIYHQISQNPPLYVAGAIFTGLALGGAAGAGLGWGVFKLTFWKGAASITTAASGFGGLLGWSGGEYAAQEAVRMKREVVPLSVYESV